jgi:hypothetical protein
MTRRDWERIRRTDFRDCRTAGLRRPRSTVLHPRRISLQVGSVKAPNQLPPFTQALNRRFQIMAQEFPKNHRDTRSNRPKRHRSTEPIAHCACLELQEDRLLLATWTGGEADNHWTTAADWDVAPFGGMGVVCGAGELTKVGGGQYRISVAWFDQHDVGNNQNLFVAMNPAAASLQRSRKNCGTVHRDRIPPRSRRWVAPGPI